MSKDNTQIHFTMQDGTLIIVSLDSDTEFKYNDDGSGTFEVKVDEILCPSGGSYIGEDIPPDLIMKYKSEINEQFENLIKIVIEHYGDGEP